MQLVGLVALARHHQFAVRKFNLGRSLRSVSLVSYEQRVVDAAVRSDF